MAIKPSNEETSACLE